MLKTVPATCITLTLLAGSVGAGIAAAKGSQPANLTHWLSALREQKQVMEPSESQIQIREQARPESPENPASTPTPDCDGTQLRDRDQIRQRDRDRLNQTGTTESLHLNSSNPWTPDTPIPYSGYGPGPGTCDTCTLEPGPNRGGNGNQP